MKMPAQRDISLQNIMFPLLSLVVGTAFFYYASPILIPLVVACSLTYLLLPAVDLIKRLKVPHTIAVIVIMLMVLGLFVLLVVLLVGQIADLASTLPQYKDKAVTAINHAKDALAEYFGFLRSGPGGSQDFMLDAKELKSVGRYLFKGLGSVTSFAFGSTLIFFLTMFMLLDSEMFGRKLKSVFGKESSQATETILREINRQLKGFIQVKFAVVIVLSIIFTAGLLILGVKYAYVWGPLAGILNLIPYVGSVVGAVPPIIVAGIQFNSVWYMIYVAIFFAVIQFFEGNIITPRLTSETVDLNTLAVILATMYWGWLWGGMGVILAVPITAAVKVICDHVEPLKPIGIMLGTAGSD